MNVLRMGPLGAWIFVMDTGSSSSAAQALLALADAHPQLAGSLHASLIAALLCLARGCTPAALGAALQLPDDARLDVRRTGILQAAQLVWDSPPAAQPCAAIAAKVALLGVPSSDVMRCMLPMSCIS